MSQAQVGGKFAALCIKKKGYSQQQKERLLSTAEEVLGRQKKKIQPWVINKILDLCNHRRQLKEQKYTEHKH